MHAALNNYFLVALISWPFIVLFISWIGWMEENTCRMRISALHVVIAFVIALLPMVNFTVAIISVFGLLAAAIIWVLNTRVGKPIKKAYNWLNCLTLWPR
jgi:hypothetical protein